MNYTKGQWKWQGEDYRGEWGWQILVNEKGEGIIVGQDDNNQPCQFLQAGMPINPDVCITGIKAEGKPHVNAVHVREGDAHLISAAPLMYETLLELRTFLTGGRNEILSTEFAGIKKALAKVEGEEGD